jgi:hypothetical protein
MHCVSCPFKFSHLQIVRHLSRGCFLRLDDRGKERVFECEETLLGAQHVSDYT